MWAELEEKRHPQPTDQMDMASTPIVQACNHEEAELSAVRRRHAGIRRGRRIIATSGVAEAL